MNIRELYRTFLGKFDFFGKIIDILIKQENEIQELKSKISVMETTCKEYDHILSVHNQKLIDIHESEAPQKKETSRNLTNTGTEIMQNIYQNYHATGEVTKDA